MPKKPPSFLDRSIASYRALRYQPGIIATYDIATSKCTVEVTSDGLTIAVLRAPGGTEVAWYEQRPTRNYRHKRRPGGLPPIERD